MHDIEIEFRYLANTLAPNTIATLTDSCEPDEKSHYANFTIDRGVKLRSKKSPLRVRLYEAASADIFTVLNEKPADRLAFLRKLAARTRRELECTLKVPTVKGKGRGELEHFIDIANQLNLGINLHSVEEFDDALRDARLRICGAVYTERCQWNLGKLTNYSSLIVTRDASRCHHQLNGQAREIIEVEALVSLEGEPSKTQITTATREAEAALKKWITMKLGFLPESVIGTAGACIIAHDAKLAREMFAQKAIKLATLLQMVNNHELSEENRQVIIG
jgi:uncharacterized protein YjbK